MSEGELSLFQFGPVQEFIAQAETLGDLRAGSELLSTLTAAALAALPAGSRRVFPAEGTDEGLPNRFLAFVPKGSGAAAMAAAEAALRGALRAAAERVLADHPEWAARRVAFLAQVEAFPQITWAVLADPPARMGEAYKAIGRLMALRRNTRDFAAWHEEAPSQGKDLLSGKEAALDERLELGAMNLVKRARAEAAGLGAALDERYAGRYVAVLAMDGDRMGERLSEFETEEEHQAFSRSLLGFAKVAREIIERYDGTPVYLGGDDVLAVLPAPTAVACAGELAAAFDARIHRSASAGIAVGHRSVPWQELVSRAHAAERRAKQAYGRAALALAIHKRTGEVLEWGCKWGSEGIKLLGALTNPGQDGLGRFPYKLAGLLQPYGLKGALPEGLRDVVLAEAMHAVAQTEGLKWKADRECLEAVLDECAPAHAEDFVGLFLCAAFLVRKSEEGRDAN